MMPTPRPYCATAPERLRFVCTSTFEPAPTLSRRNTETALAPPRPFASVPWAETRAVRLPSAMSSNLTSPANVSATGPSRTLILPLYLLSPSTSVSSAPGMQGVMRSMSSSTFHACAGGSGTSKELSNSISIPAGPGGCRAGDLSEDCARGQPGAAGIIEIKQPAHQFAGGIKPADRLIIGVEHLGLGGDPHASKGKGHAAGYRIAFERRRIEGVCPIALVDGEPLGAPAILDVGVEWDVGADRLVVFGNGRKELLCVDAFELFRELLDGDGAY